MDYPEAVILNGVKFPVKSDGYTVSRNKIMSANTGRNNNAKMVGTIIAIKTKVEVELLPIPPTQAEIIDNVLSDINNPFPTATILYLSGKQKQVTVYTSDTVSYHWLSQDLGDGGLITGVKISFIEQ